MSQGDLSLTPKRNRREFDCEDGSCFLPDVEMDRLKRDLQALEDEARLDVPFGNASSMARYKRDVNKDKEKKERERKLSKFVGTLGVIKFYFEFYLKTVKRKHANFLRIQHVSL